jgi:hypothetical protein
MAGVVREHLAEIELKIKLGIRVAHIHAELITGRGMNANLWSFRKEITRARERNRKAGNAMTGTVVPTTNEVKDINKSADPAMTQNSQGVVKGLDKYFVRKSMFDTKD